MEFAPIKAPELAKPFPGEPGDLPAVSERPSGDAALIQKIDHIAADLDRVLMRNHRYELAFVAAVVGCQGTLNFVSNAVGKLDASDWRRFPDLAHALHRQATELAATLAPVCAGLSEEAAQQPAVTG